MKLTKLFLLLLLIAPSAYAQTAPPADPITIQQNLKGLNVLGSVLYIAAHPDDENTRLLAYLAQEKHYRTGYLSLTRGDGGQNLIGNEQSELLGLMRTQELLAARRIDGAEQFFTRANDFGFSKTPGETLKIWDKEKVLSDVVWVIRKFRPDVMICRFPTTGEGGHGHHTSSAILAQEAFKAAADPTRFPEQLKYVQVWQAKRLLWNTFNFGGTNTTSADQFKLDIGVYNPLLGKGYGEIAAESRSNHKSQGFGAAKQRGEWFEFFKTILGDAPKTDLMDGVNTTWARIAGGNEIGRQVDEITRNFVSDRPAASAPSLVRLLDAVDIEFANDKAMQTVRLAADGVETYTYWHRQKTKQLKDLIAACTGLWFESYAAEPTYAVGDTVKVINQVIIRSNAPVRILAQRYTSFKTDTNAVDSSKIVAAAVLKPNALSVENTQFVAAKITQPYWLQYPHDIGTYNIDHLDSTGNAEQKTLPQTFQNTIFTVFEIDGRKIEFEHNIVYKYTDPVRGEVYQPLEITPPVTANIENKIYLFQSRLAQTVKVKLKSFIRGDGSISLKPVAGWKISPEKIDFTGKNKNDEWTVAFTVTPANSTPNTTALEAVVDIQGKSWSLGFQRIKYEHIPNITLFPKAEAKLVNLDLKTAGKNIGYIAGAGDKMPDALRQAGYTVHMLNEEEIMNSNLAVYDAIIAGVRTYNVSDRIVFEQPTLMEYVKNGGIYVVQYNTAGSTVTNNIGPYPFSVVNQRVTEEDAKVAILEPNSPVLNYPNKITDADFSNWIQERGLYFADNIDPKYSTPLQMNDTGMTPNKGSLLVTDYGKGRFVYTSLAFFRELPAGVPGAFRLFVNLLSRPKN